MYGPPFLPPSKLSLLSLKSSSISLWVGWVLTRAKHLAIDLWSLVGTVWELRVTFATCLYVNQDLSHCLQCFHSLLISYGTEIRDKFTSLSVLQQKLLIVDSVSWRWTWLIKYIIPHKKIVWWSSTEARGESGRRSSLKGAVSKSTGAIKQGR